MDLPATGASAGLPTPQPVHWWMSALAAGCTVIVATICVGPLWATDPNIAGPTVLYSAALVAVGVILRGEPGQSSAARTLILAGALWPLSWIDSWAGGPWPVISIFASPLSLLLTGWVIYRYPDPREVSQWEQWFLRVLSLWIVVGRIAVILTSYPLWRGHPAGSWWLPLWPDRGLNQVLANLTTGGQAILLVPFLTQWFLRVRRVRGLDRQLLRPVVVAAIIAGMASVAVPVAAAAGLANDAVDKLYSVQTTLLLSVPIAFAVAALRRRLTSTVIASLVQRLRREATPENLEQAFQEALADPGLRVYYWSADLGRHVDRRGQILTDASMPSAGLLLPITTANAQPLAMIRADQALRRYPDLVTAAVSVGALAIENARLQVATRAQLEQMRASHARIINVGLAERQVLERDLNTGALRRIRGLLHSLSDNEAAIPAELRSVVRYATDQLSEVVVELRDIAGGLHPSILDDVGLLEAVARMCRSQPVPITVDLPCRQFPISVEVAAYYVVAEAITNAVRHAEASWIVVEGADTGTTLRLTVRDNGRGGADLAGGTGLSGLSERVHALGGDVSLISPRTIGTTLTVEIPCG